MPLLSWKKTRASARNANEGIAELNVPAKLARMCAAYKKASSVLRGGIFKLSDTQRVELYRKTLALLDTAIEASSDINARNRRRGAADPLTQYFTLIRDTLKAASSLVAQDILLLSEASQLSEFINPGLSRQLRTADDIFSAGEVSVVHAVCDLIDHGTPAVERHCDRIRQRFNDEQRARYERTLAEYDIHYKNFV